MPGMITGPNDGIGYDLDWLAPTNKAAWLTSRTGEGIIPVKPSETISIQYGPKAQASSPTKFVMKMRMGRNGADYSATQVFQRCTAG